VGAESAPKTAKWGQKVPPKCQCGGKKRPQNNKMGAESAPKVAKWGQKAPPLS